MTFLDGLVREYTRTHFPGRDFDVVACSTSDDYLVREFDASGSIVRTAELSGRMLRELRWNKSAETVRGVMRILDKAFDTRSPTERLPWQCFSAYV